MWLPCWEIKGLEGFLSTLETPFRGTQAPLSVLMGKGSKQCHLEVLAKATRMKC